MTRRAAHRAPSPTDPPQRRGRPRRTRGFWPRLGVFLTAVVGIGVLLYPSASRWFSAQAQGAELSAYADQVAQTPTNDQEQLLKKAQEYNAALPHGQLQDPYSSVAASGADVAAATANYLSQLKVPGTDIMARVDIPSIGADLPIRHGTSHAVLTQGAGHLYGSSIPVGGPGTHAVLAGHSGLADAKMLTDLVKVHLGDRFTINVLGETLYYRVDKISVVKPDDLHDLTIEPGKDYVTLVTCTPINVNTHRLLVRGERIPAPTADAQLVSGGADAGFPYWAVVLGFAVLAAFALAFLPGRRKRQPGPPAEARPRGPYAAAM